MDAPKVPQVLLVWDALRKQQSNIPPTIRDLMKATGISSSSVVRYHLKTLEKNDVLIRIPNVARGLMLTEKGRNHVVSDASLYTNGRTKGSKGIEHKQTRRVLDGGEVNF